MRSVPGLQRHGSRVENKIRRYRWYAVPAQTSGEDHAIAELRDIDGWTEACLVQVRRRRWTTLSDDRGALTKVLGHTVSPETEAACLARMRNEWFTAAQLADVANHLGVPWAKDYRFADRLIQRERKAGNIV